MDFVQELNGQTVTTDDLRLLSFLPYGHFTSMQVRQYSVKGLSLHLRRLQESSRTIWGVIPDTGTILHYLRGALHRHAHSCSVRINIFSRVAGYKPVHADDLQILITLTPPADLLTAPFAVKTTVYERVLPEVKHLGIAMGLLAFRETAMTGDYEDVLYTDAQGNISEGSIWNIGFYDGRQLLLPDTPALPGITLQLMTTRLAATGWAITTRTIHLSEVAGFKAAVAFNSIMPGRPVNRIDQVVYPEHEWLNTQL